MQRSRVPLWAALGCVEEQRMRLQGSRVPGTWDLETLSGWGLLIGRGGALEFADGPWDAACMHNTDRICETHAVRFRSGLRPQAV